MFANLVVVRPGGRACGITETSVPCSRRPFRHVNIPKARLIDAVDTLICRPHPATEIGKADDDCGTEQRTDDEPASCLVVILQLADRPPSSVLPRFTLPFPRLWFVTGDGLEDPIAVR